MELTNTELSEHTQDEQVIERGLKAFYEVGSALLRIRERRSYRLTHETFEAYCKDRWDIVRSRAYQLVEAAQVTTNLSTIVDILPATESQCRPLTNLTPDDQQAVWQKVIDSGKKVTAKLVKEFVYEHFCETEPEGLRDAEAGDGWDDGCHDGWHAGWKSFKFEWKTHSPPETDTVGALTNTEKKLALRLIKTGYRTLAVELHPDHEGGSEEDMKALNKIRALITSYINQKECAK